MSKRILIVLSLIFTLLLSAYAQDSGERIITITYDGGNRRSPDLRYGPYIYTHPQPEGLIANVSNLTIYARQAKMKAPEGVLISQAQGQREASFAGGVRVTRGRLEATGPSLVYSETSGLGVMPEATQIVIAPGNEGEDPVEISAATVTFDVDTDVSISRGKVRLVNGDQSAEAEELVFEEERNLARLRSEGQQVNAKRQSEEGELIIIADEIRALTDQNNLLASGNVTIIDGNITSKGDTVYFDDEASRAEVIGNPAVSVNAELGLTISGARLEQLTDIDVVEVLDESVPSQFDVLAFRLSSEAAE